MNPIFNALGGGMMPMLQQFKQNPLGMLRQFGFNVPANMNNPNEIIQHLMNSGQLSQEQYNQARQMAQTFGIK
jgi:phenylalanyl-tRNA synthetase alpha subunit